MFSHISEMTDEEFNSLIEDYYNGEGNAIEILENHHVDMTETDFVRELPMIPNPEGFICDYCGELLLYKLPSRRTYQTLKGELNLCALRCPKCGHKPYNKKGERDKTCRCRNCIAKRDEEKKQKRAAAAQKQLELRKRIDSYCIPTCPPYKYDQLSFRQKVYLGALLRGYLSEDWSIIHANTYDDTIPLAPIKDIVYNIYNDLIDSGIIYPSSTSSTSAFNFNENGTIKSYYFLKTDFRLNIDFEGSPSNFFKQILSAPKYYVPETNSSEAQELALEIAVAECIENLLYQLDAVNLTGYEPEDKTRQVFEEALTKYSVSQIFTVIYSRVAYAVRWKAEQRVPAVSAAKSVLTRILNYLSRVEDNQWTISSSWRPKDCPQSHLSAYFYANVLRVGNRGFDECIYDVVPVVELPPQNDQHVDYSKYLSEAKTVMFLAKARREAIESDPLTQETLSENGLAIGPMSAEDAELINYLDHLSNNSLEVVTALMLCGRDILHAPESISDMPWYLSHDIGQAIDFYSFYITDNGRKTAVPYIIEKIQLDENLRAGIEWATTKF